MKDLAIILTALTLIKIIIGIKATDDPVKQIANLTFRIMIFSFFQSLLDGQQIVLDKMVI